MLVGKSDRVGTGALSIDFLLRMLTMRSFWLTCFCKRVHWKTPPPNIQMMGYKRDSDLMRRSLDSFHFEVVFLPEAEGLSDMSTSSIWCHGYHEPNVYIFISSSGPSDAYSSTLSSLNFNLWPHLTDQMVFPKINHGFLSADQQLIKRRLIKVVLLPAGVWFPLRVHSLPRAWVLGISLSCMAQRWWVGLCQYSRRKLYLLTDSIESPPVFILLFFFN